MRVIFSAIVAGGLLAGACGTPTQPTPPKPPTPFVTPVLPKTTVWSVSGNVTDGSQPIADAVVEVSSRAFYAAPWTHTDAAGRYSVDGMPYANGFVHATLSGVTQPCAVAYAGAANGLTSADVLVFRADQLATADLSRCA